MKLTTLTFLLVLIIAPAPGAAAAVSVIEVGPQLMENTLQAIRALKSNENEAVMMLRLLEIMKRLEGIYNQGKRILKESIQTRKYTPEDYYKILQMYGKNGGNSRVNEIIMYFKQEYPVYNESQLNPSGTEAGRRNAKAVMALEESVGSTSAVSVHALERVHDQLGELKRLSEAIDTTANAKSSLDINARITAQAGIVLTELTTLLSKKSESDAQHQRIRVEDNKRFQDFMTRRRSGSSATKARRR